MIVNISKLDGHVITFLRFCAKCFGKGVDERNGCYADFCTYCRDKMRGTPSFLLEVIDLMLFSLWQNLHFFIRTMY